MVIPVKVTMTAERGMEYNLNTLLYREQNGDLEDEVELLSYIFKPEFSGKLGPTEMTRKQQGLIKDSVERFVYQACLEIRHFMPKESLDKLVDFAKRSRKFLKKMNKLNLGVDDVKAETEE